MKAKKLLLAALAVILTGCGGTLTIRPDGVISYTTPEIVKPRILPEK